jgi:pyridoxine 5-phosphate synthase
LAEADVRVSLFIDAEPRQLEAAVEIGVPVVEIHTGHYADAQGRQASKEALGRIAKAVSQGIQLGLQVNVGHGLDYHNIKAVAAIEGILEFNIGHAIISRAVFSGLQQAVADMKHLLQPPSA